MFAALSAAGITYAVTRYGPVGSLAEAAALRGVAPGDIADASIIGRTVSMGAGAHGVAVTVSGDDVIRGLAAQVADVADPPDA